MPEVIFNGPEGRLEGRFTQKKETGAPIALILHPLPQLGGNMNNPVAYQLYHQFADRGFSVLRFNFRGVGRSQGEFDEGLGELSDAAAALDWLQALSVDARQCWIAGYSFGAWIGMQLLMRRPEISGFISIAPPANFYDFTFLAPCPARLTVLCRKMIPKNWSSACKRKKALRWSMKTAKEPITSLRKIWIRSTKPSALISTAASAKSASPPDIMRRPCRAAPRRWSRVAIKASR